MSERENFLERWSRKKAHKKAQVQREAAEAPDAPAAPDAQPGASGDAASGPIDASDRRAPAAPPSALPGPAAAKPEFDLASLPSLDSITAATDIRAFLAPGVPQELSRAALRRAWTADPAIRDFVGLAENDWDFTKPDAIPGFGDIPPDYDIKKMIAEIFGDTGRKTEQAAVPEAAERAASEPQPTAMAAESPSAEPAAETAGESAGAARPASLPGAAATSGDPATTDFVQRNSNSASQQSIADAPTKETKRRRSHGGALPQS